MTLDLVRDLPAALTDRAAAWRLIADIAAFWGAPLTSDSGCADAELDAAEARLGLTLPAALREAYRLVGNRPDLTGNQDTLLPPEKLYVDRDCLVYRVENQSCAYWGIPLAALDRADPPTVAWPDVAPTVEPEIGPWTASFSAECLGIVLIEPLFDDSAYLDGGGVDPAGLTGWTELPRVHAPGVDTRFFVRPDALLVLQGDAWLAVRAVDEESLDAICDELPEFED
ncbi:SMI1/KNR4 family protein [Kitasatospora sp. NPDC092948]|uniref:SMI1/KNR4 family protein n=1 Tax=Kitasatospora sp. NPDC092948 TaxID=3364088 RepID=UPI0037FE19D2